MVAEATRASAARTPKSSTSAICRSALKGGWRRLSASKTVQTDARALLRPQPFRLVDLD
ncbi:hypothetical protein LN650_01760 [Klebsiella pneumoniae subsp. pneumoniae]|nr:hypothetical protein [Klebsiella pneumoniae subsp. pneumoniae]